MKILLLVSTLLGLTAGEKTCSYYTRTTLKSYCRDLPRIADKYMEISVDAPHYTPTNDFYFTRDLKNIEIAAREITFVVGCGLSGTPRSFSNDRQDDQVLIDHIKRYEKDARRMVKSLRDDGDKLSLERQMEIKVFVGDGAAKLKDEVVGRGDYLGCRQFE